MPDWFAGTRNDVVGGIVSAGVAVPLAMGYGMFAFVALGENYFANGALAGLTSAFIVGIVCVLLGDKTTTVYAPRINSTFFIGLLIYGLVHSDIPMVQSGGVPLVLAITFSVILLGGIFESLFGLVGLGTLIKFAPHPVMAGFQNAAALLLLLVQLGNVCGFDHNVPFTQVLLHVSAIKPLSVLIAAVTIAAMWNARRLPVQVPSVIVGISVGTALYYVFQSTGLGTYVGPVIESEPAAHLGFTAFPYIAELGRSNDASAVARIVVGGALALAVIASIDALLCARLMKPLGERSSDGDKLLMRLGAGNVVAACFGGLTSGLNLGPSHTNRAFGARTPLSVLVNAAALLVVSTALLPLAGLLPRVALSAVIMVLAIQHFDVWSLRLARDLATGATPLRHIAAIDLAVVILVALLSLTLDIILAVFIGIVIAILMFVVTMSRSIIRRSFRCGAVRSRRSRPAKERDLLALRGDAILAIELQGALFFGTSEKLADEIDKALAQETSWLLLDFRRASEIDSTGALALVEIGALMAQKHKTLLLVVKRQSLPFLRLQEFGVLDTIVSDQIFSDMDRALEFAEDALLRAEAALAPAADEIPLSAIGVLEDFGEQDIATIASRLARATYQNADVIFMEGAPGDELMMLTRGTASAYLKLPTGESIRLATFGPGTIFGELALLDEGVRSASVVADDSLVCYSLSKADFAALAVEAPSVAIKLLAGLGRELSGRLRIANRTIHQLEI